MFEPAGVRAWMGGRRVIDDASTIDLRAANDDEEAVGARARATNRTTTVGASVRPSSSVGVLLASCCCLEVAANAVVVQFLRPRRRGTPRHGVGQLGGARQSVDRASPLSGSANIQAGDFALTQRLAARRSSAAVVCGPVHFPLPRAHPLRRRTALHRCPLIPFHHRSDRRRKCPTTTVSDDVSVENISLLRLRPPPPTPPPPRLVCNTRGLMARAQTSIFTQSPLPTNEETNSNRAGCSLFCSSGGR